MFCLFLSTLHPGSFSLISLGFTALPAYFLCDCTLCFFHCRAACVTSENSNISLQDESLKTSPLLTVRQIFIGEGGSPLTPILGMTSVYPGHGPVTHTSTELLLELGLCYRAPGGLAAGAGGRQEQAPPAMDSSSALAESARERPELGMTPSSKVPDGFICRPQLRIPSPLNFPALLFFWDLFFQLDQYIFQSRPPTPHQPVLPAFLPPFVLHHQHRLPPLLWSHLVKSCYFPHKAERL